jgi:cytochrome P450/nitrite reductase/ring-hydroxylating ferredoxin subunit
VTREGFRKVAIGAELHGSGPFAVSAEGVDVVLARVDGAWVAFDGVCPHQGALLGEGELEDGRLVCRNHRWAFDARTGVRHGGPGCLRACPVEQRDDEIWVDPSPLRERRAAGETRGRELASLPSPPWLPFVGNAHRFDARCIHVTLEEWTRKLGTVFRLQVGRQRGLAVADPVLIERALRARPNTFRRISNLETIFDELAIDGVFSAEEPAWRPQRRLAMEALSPRHLRTFYETLKTVVARLERRWRAAAEEGREVDLEDDLKRFTVDVTNWLAFDHDSNTLEQGDDVIQRELEVVFPGLMRRLAALIPYWRLFRLPRDRELERAVGEIRKYLAARVEEARERIEAEPARADRPANFLEAMLAARDERGRPFAAGVILGNAIQMLLAGEDTTANTLAWAVHELCDAPEAVRGLRAELDGALDGERFPASLDVANRLAFASAVANETMRLRPVAPLLFLEAIEDTRLGDVEVPAGTAVFLIMRPAVLDPANFYEPATFRPERWLAGRPAGEAHEAATLMPFGSGPRICPGRSLALVEMRVVLATLYASFDVERVGPRDDVREELSFTMKPTGLRLRLRPRRAGGGERAPLLPRDQEI